jgi:hypothetical protein
MRYAILSMLMLGLTGCLSMALMLPDPTLDVKQDEFKGVKTATLKMYVHSSETHRFAGTDVPYFSSTMNFYREIGKNSQVKERVAFSIRTDIEKENMKGDMIILIGDRKLSCKLDNSSFDKIMDIEVTQTGVGPNARVSDIDTTNYKVLKSAATLSKDFDSLVSADVPVRIRMYSGDAPMTFVVEKNNLAKLYEFCNVR